MMQFETGPMSLYSHGAQCQSYVQANARAVTYVPQYAGLTIYQQNVVQVSIDSHIETQAACTDPILAPEKKSRKPRLRWSSELHDRFVKAVNDLGGAKRASPKAIQKIMSVDGLTLLHLKSHLQKYRHAKHGGRQRKEPKRPRTSRRGGNMAKQPFNGGAGSSSTSPIMASGFHKAEVSSQGHIAAETQMNYDSSRVWAGAGQLQQSTVACNSLAAGMTVEVPQNETGFSNPFPVIHLQDLASYEDDDTYGLLPVPDFSVEGYLEHNGHSTSWALENLPGFGGEASAVFGPCDYGQTCLALDREMDQLMSTMDRAWEGTYANLP